MTLEGCEYNTAVQIGLSDADTPLQSIVFDRVTFRQNMNYDLFVPGGAIFASGQLNAESGLSNLKVAIRHCTFRDNEAEMGSAVYGEQCALEIVHSRFVNNSARKNGGAIYVIKQGTQLTISDSHFQSNTVTDEGWRREVGREGGDPIEHDVYFEFESPRNGGGAIAAISAEDLAVTRTTFLSNRGVSGGAIYAVLDATELRGLQKEISIDITECVFRDNEARIGDSTESGFSDNRLGGAIYVASATAKLKDFHLSDSIFQGNSAQSSGGALHVVAVFRDNIQIDGCTFERNEAGQAGGAALLRNSGNIIARNTTWSRNTAGLGGAILLTNGAQFTAKSTSGSTGDASGEWRSHFEENSAVDGGGLMCAGCGILELRGMRFMKNHASRDGGGLFVLDANRLVNIQECHFHSNDARHGGGAAFRAAANVVFATSTDSRWNAFVNNSAVSGGGLLVEGSRQKENSFELKTCRFHENRAVGFDAFGGRLATEGTFLSRRRQTLSSSSTGVAENAAANVAVGEASAMSDCGDGGGGGACFAFDHVPERAMADILTLNIEFRDNHALVGGGMFVSIAGNWSTEDDTVCTSDPFDVEPCRLFHLIKMKFLRNTATFGAGGLFVTDPELVMVGCDETSSGQEGWLPMSETQTERGPSTDCFLFEENAVLESGGIYGPNVASRVEALFIVDPPSGKITDHKGGERLLPPCKDATDCRQDRESGIKIEVRDAFNQIITGGIPDAGLVVLALSADILGEQTYRARNGIINVNQTIGVGVQRESVIEFRYQRGDGKQMHVNLEFTTRECLPGEVALDNSCTPCPDDQYAFETKSMCLDCEKHAKCFGGSVLVPEDGYWHSTPYSPQFHECFIQGACVYEDRAETLARYHRNVTRVLEDLAELDVYVEEKGTHPVYDSYLQCAEGYRGILCGTCEDGFGRLDGGECRRCSGKTHFALTSLLSFLATIFLMIIQIWATSALVSENATVVSAMARNSKGRLRSGLSIKFTDVFADAHLERRPPDELASAGRSLPVGFSSEGLIEPVAAVPPRLTRSMTRWQTFKERWVREPAMKKRDPLVTDHTVAREKLSETLKIFVNYLQITSAASAISVSWFAPVRYALSIQSTSRIALSALPRSAMLCCLGSLVSFTNGLFYVPLECVIENHSLSAYHAIRIFWYRMILHLVSLPVLCLVEWTITHLKQRKRKAASNDVPLIDDESADGDAAQDDSGDRAELRRQKEKARDDSMACIVVVLLVFIFQAYSTITATFMEAVNCIRVDESLADNQESRNDHPYGRYAIEGVSRVWTQNPSLYCFQDEHWVTGMAGAVGLTSSFLFIIWIFCWIHSNKDRWKDLTFVKRYGFLYNSYKKERLGPYWEGVVFLRKALIQASVVFAIRLGPNLQSASALGVLLVSLAAHWIERPFEAHEDHPNVPEYCGQYLEYLKPIVPGIVCWAWRYLLGALSLNGLEAASMLMSISVFYTGIVSYDPNATETAKDVVATGTFFLNFLYVLYMLHRLYAGTHLMLDMSITYYSKGLAADPSDEDSLPSFDAENAKGPGPIALVRKALWVRACSVTYAKRVTEREDEMHVYFNRGNPVPSGPSH